MENHSPTQNSSTIAIPLSPDARQTVLQNDFILREIFAYLRVPSLALMISPSRPAALPDVFTVDRTSRTQTRRFLGRAALVCRAFSEPARDALWSSLDSLRPIFNVLNPGWQKRLEEIVTVTTFPNLSTFTSLARKIKELNHHPQLEKTPVPSRMIAYCASRVSKGENGYPNGLLPTLRILRCTLDSGHIQEVFHLITPSLKHLALYNITKSIIPTVTELVVKLVCVAPSLSVLVLRGEVKDIIFDDILRFESLTSLSITSENDVDRVTVQNLRLLGALQCLKSIEIDLANWDKSWDKSEDPDRLARSIWTSESTKTLTSVSVSGNPRAVLAFMSGINGASLVDLEVRIGEGNLTKGVLQLYSALQGLGKYSLRSLFIVDQARILLELGSGIFNTPEYYCGMPKKSLVEFLCFFPYLENLTYYAPRFFLQRSELERITQIAPLPRTLRTFSLPISFGSYSGSPPQINDLRTLILQRPLLEHIQLYLHIASKNIPDPRTFGSNSTSQLKVLSLGSSTSTTEELDGLIHSGDLLRLAGCLDKLFPKLVEIRYNEDSPVQSKLWKLVFEMIKFKRQ